MYLSLITSRVAGSVMSLRRLKLGNLFVSDKQVKLEGSIFFCSSATLDDGVNMHWVFSPSHSGWCKFFNFICNLYFSIHQTFSIFRNELIKNERGIEPGAILYELIKS